MRRDKGQLVCEHLENISRSTLEAHQDIVRDLIHGRHGIYALFKRSKLYYAGLASDLRVRLKQHLSDRHANTWDRFSIYLTVGDDHLRDLEALLLRVSTPKGNKQSTRFTRSQDMMRNFKRAIKDKQRTELEFILGGSGSQETKERNEKIEKGRTPALANHVNKVSIIRFRYKDRLYRARVRKDGTISYKGKTYNSPSLAAQAIRRGGINGWYVWQYERAPGDWVLLNELRKK